MIPSVGLVAYERFASSDVGAGRLRHAVGTLLLPLPLSAPAQC